MTPQPAPSGVTYEGSNGMYHIRLNGRLKGLAVSNYDTWTVKSANPAHSRWAWTAPTRNQAAAQLLTWLEEQP